MNDAVELGVRQVAADVFNLPLNQVTAETSPRTVENWDSVQHLNFVLALEETMGIGLAPEDIEQIRSVGDAIDVVRKKREK